MSVQISGWTLFNVSQVTQEFCWGFFLFCFGFFSSLTLGAPKKEK